MALLDAAPLLVKRLTDECRSAAAVKCEDDLAGVLASAARDKSIYLMLAEYGPHADDGASDTVWREVWIVVVVIKQVSPTESQQKAYAAARPLLAEVIKALDGWRCRPAIIGAVRAVPGPRPKITDGVAYLPLAFSLDTVTDGADDVEV